MNVVIARLPLGKSIVSPPSSCPKCGNSIKAYDNIPVLSYIFLGGKCRNCKTKISIQYPIVELVTGILILLTFLKYGMTPAFGVYALFVFLLLAMGFTDLFTSFDHKNFECGVIPDILSVGGLVLGLATSYFTIGVKDSVIGALAGFLALFLPAFVYKIVKKVEGMGGGDLKLVAMIGSFLGWKSIYFVVFGSALIGVLVGIPSILILKNKDYMMPFGPFLVLAGILYMFFSDILNPVLFPF